MGPKDREGSVLPSCFVSTGTGCEFVKSGIHITYHDNIDSPATAGPDSPEPEETDLPKTPEQPKPAETVLPRPLKRDSENPLQTRSHKRPRNPPAIRTPTWATAPIPTRLLHFESLLHPLRALSYPPDLREPAGSPQVTRLSLLRRLPPLRWLPPSRWSPSLRRSLSSKLKRALRVPDLPRVTNGWLRSRRGWKVNPTGRARALTALIFHLSTFRTPERPRPTLRKLIDPPLARPVRPKPRLSQPHIVLMALLRHSQLFQLLLPFQGPEPFKLAADSIEHIFAQAIQGLVTVQNNFLASKTAIDQQVHSLYDMTLISNGAKTNVEAIARITTYESSRGDVYHFLRRIPSSRRSSRRQRLSSASG